MNFQAWLKTQPLSVQFVVARNPTGDVAKAALRDWKRSLKPQKKGGAK